ncbi:hypothetical protein ACHHYP_09860 [Achlya hypogyna]|uniref:DUF4097 domain-containing protein n=1 Tax=Achlya hypogyna TaxID=1202772 RepID=A0A1V9ZIR5_ACHHY|nr:hypothetical protein ACHHYP_09860 [Achlya hypogyna]
MGKVSSPPKGSLMRHTTLPRISTATPGVQRACSLNFVVSLAGAPLSFVLGQRSEAFHTLFVLAGALSVLSVLGSAIGMIKTTPTLVCSMLLTIAASYGAICTGGMSILYLPFVEAELATYTDAQYAESVLLHHTLDDKVAREKTYLIAAGAVLLAIGLTSAYLVRKLHKALGEKRSAVTFLQAFGIGMVPFAFILIAGGQYIITSQALASAPYTGIFTFLCGLLALILALMAFIGSAFEYRRLLNTFSWFAFILAIMLLASAIASLVVTGSIESSIVECWPTLRVVLPPTLPARYDQGQFLLFVQRNLRGVSYVAIISGLFLMLQSLSAIALNDITHVVKRRHAQDKRCNLDPELHPDFVARREWRLLFKASKRSQRIFMRVSCAGAMIVFVTITVLMTLSVVFSTQCARIGKAENTTTLPVTRGTVSLAHGFGAGSLSVSQGSDAIGRVSFQQRAVSTKYLTTSALQHTQTAAADSFVAAPTSSSYVFWIDTSCQLAAVELVLPNATGAPAIVLSSKMAAVDVNLLTPSLDISTEQLAGLNVSTEEASVNCFGAYLGPQALTITSNSGDINVSAVLVNATGPLGEKAPTALSSTLGGITLTNASFLNSPISLTTDASPIIVGQVLSQATHGYSDMALATQSGTIALSDVMVDRISLASQTGAIQAEELTAMDNGVFAGRIDAVSVGGAVQLHNTAVTGYVHIETNSGDVYLHLKSTSFAGFFYARSEHGVVSVHRSNYSYDALTMLPTQDPREARGLINCGSSCNYQGDIYIRSQYGNIDLVLGCENSNCS